MIDDLFQPPILTFDGEYRFLSNFYPASFVWQDNLWLTSEHAYQAAKCIDPAERTLILNLPTAVATKRAGKLVKMRPDWDEVKVDLMLEIVFEKFNQNPELKAKLLATGSARIEEGNTWRDTTWGICPPGSNKGQNHLGRILMDLRAGWING
jgi:hypothetical protein